MLIHIDPQSADPIFEQIVFQVKGAIAKGETKPGDKLPSVRELARELSVNPNTVVRSYQTLEQDGLIIRRQGAGCFIKEGATMLSDEARGSQLEELMERAVTEAFHLGFSKEEIKKALNERLRQVRFTRKGGKK